MALAFYRLLFTLKRNFGINIGYFESRYLEVNHVQSLSSNGEKTHYWK